MINAEKLGIMKKSARIINTSRGGIIDEDALYNALKEGNLAGTKMIKIFFYICIMLVFTL